MKRASAAEGDEREIARIETTVDRDEPDGVDHVEVDELDDRRRDLLDLHAELAAESRPALVRAASTSSDELTAEEVLGLEPTEHEVGVRHGRLGAARGRSTPDQGCDPALCGPTRSKPALVDPGDEPPPAPIVRTSTIGV